MSASAFNPDVISCLSDFGIENIDAALMYLLSVYYGLNNSGLIPDEIIKQTNITKIVERDYSSNKNSVKWNMPLFTGEVVEDDRWLWVEQYRAKFAKLKSEARGDKRGTLAKMKKFFAENPDVRIDEVMIAVDWYLSPFRHGQQELTYLQGADYFISKIEKGSKKSRLSMFIEMIREKNAESNSETNRHSDRLKRS